MDRGQLRQVGMALFGERWQASLARVYPCNIRTMQRWMSGDQDIPKQAALRFVQIVTPRVEMCINALRMLEEEAETLRAEEED